MQGVIAAKLNKIVSETKLKLEKVQEEERPKAENAVEVKTEVKLEPSTPMLKAHPASPVTASTASGNFLSF
jgi:hypothetical protein